MMESADRCVRSAGNRPGIHCGVVSAARVAPATLGAAASPDNHLAAGPDCRMPLSGGRHVGCACGRPSVRGGIVSPAAVKFLKVILSTPDDHFTSSPDC